MGKKDKQREKTKLVPIALHTELSEYTSLLRALRTNDILDVASQLARPYAGSSTRASTVTARYSSLAPRPTDFADVELSDEDVGSARVAERNMDDGESEKPDSGSEYEMGGEGKAKAKKRSSRSKKKKMERDEWTRWPLMVGDVHIPEWGFADEVLFLARQSIAFRRSISSEHAYDQPVNPLESGHDLDAMEGEQEPAEDGDDIDSESEDELQPDVAHTLEALSSTHLTQVLSAVASHIPASSKSLQSRFMPLTWQHVLNIVSVEGIVDPQVIQNVQGRLEKIYGLADHPYAHRAALLSKHSNEFASADADALGTIRPFDDLAYLSSLPEYTPSRKGRKRKRRGANSQAANVVAGSVEGDKTDQSEVGSDAEMKGKGKARAQPKKKLKIGS